MLDRFSIKKKINLAYLMFQRKRPNISIMCPPSDFVIRYGPSDFFITITSGQIYGNFINIM